jgi:hypothetical protein
MGVNIFWDNSNIWLVGQRVCQNREPGEDSAFRIHFSNLLDFALNGRKPDYAFVGGSIPPSNDALWTCFEELGIKVDKRERGGVTGHEIAVDEIIQLAMTEGILDAEQPGTLVLLTDDGSGFLEGTGFIKQLQRAHKRAWEIEVVSWDAGCNRHLREYAQKHGTYRSLEPVYEKVTFVNNKRWVQPV